MGLQENLSAAMRAVMERQGKSLAEFSEELSFRISLQVTEMVLYSSGDTYPLCPKCRTPLDREYQHFCDRCGQRLDWSKYERALVVTRF